MDIGFEAFPEWFDWEPESCRNESARKDILRHFIAANQFLTGRSRRLTHCRQSQRVVLGSVRGGESLSGSSIFSDEAAIHCRASLSRESPVLYVKKLIRAFVVDLLGSTVLSAFLFGVVLIVSRLCGFTPDVGTVLRWTLLPIWWTVLCYDLVTKAIIAPWSVHKCSVKWGVSWLTAADAICLGVVREKAGQCLTSHEVEVFVDLRRRQAN